MRTKLLLLCGIFLLVITPVESRAISVVWDYTYDIHGFFTQERREVMDLVADAFSDYHIDRGALIPGGENNWSWSFPNPFGDGNVEVPNPSAGAGEIRVFLMSKNLSSHGIGGHVGTEWSGDSDWMNAISAADTYLAFKPYAGYIILNLNVDWHGGTDDNVPRGYVDLYSIALHELGHVLGIGVSNAWWSRVDGVHGTFTGSIATGLFGSAVPLDPWNKHLEQGLTYLGMPVVMVPSSTTGTRQQWTEMEYGILRDLGYVYIAPPPTPAPSPTQEQEAAARDAYYHYSNLAQTYYSANIGTNTAYTIYYYYACMGIAAQQYYTILGQPDIGNFYYYDGIAQGVLWGYNDISGYYGYQAQASYAYYANTNPNLGYYYAYANLANSWYYGYMNYYEMTGDPSYQQAAIESYDYYMSLADGGTRGLNKGLTR